MGEAWQLPIPQEGWWAARGTCKASALLKRGQQRACAPQAPPRGSQVRVSYPRHPEIGHQVLSIPSSALALPATCPGLRHAPMVCPPNID